MDMMHPEWIGGLAAVLTTSAYAPQAWKVLRSRDTRSISLGMYSLMTVGVTLWLIYGVIIEKPSIIYANIATLFLSGLILYAKIRFK